MKPPKSTVLRELLSAVQPPHRPPKRRRRRAQVVGTRRFSTTLPVDVVDRFRALCAEQGLPSRAVIEQLMRSYVARHEV